MGMSAILGWYLLFALTTALTAIYELFVPVMRDYAILEPKDNLVEYKGIAYVIMFILSFMLAPIMLPIVLVPTMSGWFKKALLDNLTLTPSKI